MAIEKTDHSTRNFRAFTWHAVFLALTKNFADINTIIPTMLIKAGGTSFHLGILTAIMVGGGSFMQLFFASFLTHKKRTKKYLQFGVYLRVLALLILGILLFYADHLQGASIIGFILFLMTIFSFSGAFANIAYSDVLGKSINAESRKRFFILKQTLASTAVLISALTARKILQVMDYPFNYSLLFILSGLLLLVASGGFWAVKEKVSEVAEKRPSQNRLKIFISAFKEDKNLRNYLYMLNSTSLSIVLIPFLIALAKKNFGVSGMKIGNYLLLQVGGMIVSNLLFKFLARGEKYKGILAVHIISGAILPIAALLFQNNQFLFMALFPLSGLVLASREIVVPGMLLEISNNENRAVYTGISGAGSIATIIFPLLGGALITSIGFTPIFVIASIIIMSSFIFSVKIQCRRFGPDNSGPDSQN